MKKKVKKKEDLLWTQHEFREEDTIDNFIKKLQILKEKFSGDAQITLSATGYDSVEFHVEYERDETDEEYHKRMKHEIKEAEKKAKATEKRQSQLMRQREKEMKELARLKSIYEK